MIDSWPYCSIRRADVPNVGYSDLHKTLGPRTWNTDPACAVLSARCSVLLFFFSSRRRHTRFDCDWSSDVCSSDLGLAPRRRWAFLLAGGSRYQDEGAEGSLDNTSPPGEQSRRGTRLTLGPSAEPEEASGRLRAESQIEPWFPRARPSCWQFVPVGPAA